jgi:hypothetical protein
MKKLLCLFLLLPGMSLANPLPCISGEELTELTNQYKELPFVRGISSEGTSVVVFANPSTGSFTIVERKGENVYCSLAVGVGFAPVPKHIQDDIKELQNKGMM